MKSKRLYYGALAFILCSHLQATTVRAQVFQDCISQIVIDWTTGQLLVDNTTCAVPVTVGSSTALTSGLVQTGTTPLVTTANGTTVALTDTATTLGGTSLIGTSGLVVTGSSDFLTGTNAATVNNISSSGPTVTGVGTSVSPGVSPAVIGSQAGSAGTGSTPGLPVSTLGIEPTEVITEGATIVPTSANGSSASSAGATTSSAPATSQGSSSSVATGASNITSAQAGTSSQPTAASTTLSGLGRRVVRTEGQASLTQIRLAELAQRKSGNTPVQAFAERMLLENTALLDLTRALAATAGVASAASVTRREQNAITRLKNIRPRNFDRAYLNYVVSTLRARIQRLQNVIAPGNNDAAAIALASEQLPILQSELEAALSLRENLETPGAR